MTNVLYLRQTQYYVIPKDAQAAVFGCKVYAAPPGTPAIPSILNEHYTEDHNILILGLNVP
jgi:hypothetical protein